MKRLVLIGASGMIGGYALRYALDDPDVENVMAIGRRKLGVSHPKLTEVLHADFAGCSAVAQPLEGQDAAVFCLGWPADRYCTLWALRPSTLRASSADPWLPKRAVT
jgi:putative NADH-flavin reductase